MQKVIDVEHAVVFGNMLSEAFYKTPEWRKARYYALKTHGNRCQLCGADPKKTPLHVDHIMPRHLYPERCLDFNNLQVMCEACHSAKGPIQVDDHRRSYTKIDPSEMKGIIRITRRHLVLEIRHPKTRAERDYLGEDLRSPFKNHRKRWRALVSFCFNEKLSYPEAVAISVADFLSFKSVKGHQFQKFLSWGDERGVKDSCDPAFDIAGYPFPSHISELLADDQRWNGGAL